MWGTTIKASRQGRHHVRQGVEDFSSHHWCREGRRRERLRWGSRGSFCNVTWFQRKTFLKNLKHPPPHDHHGRYADLAAGKKVRAPDETELSEKEMKWAIFSSTQNLYWKTCLWIKAFWREKKLSLFARYLLEHTSFSKKDIIEWFQIFRKVNKLEKNTNSQPLFFIFPKTRNVPKGTLQEER